LASDTHIFDLTHVISLIFNQFTSQLIYVGLSIQPRKCSTWALSGLFLGFFTHAKFYCPPNGINILSIPFGFASFAFKKKKEILSEDV
jgi:integral membrane sensor domain MASE1